MSLYIYVWPFWSYEGIGHIYLLPYYKRPNQKLIFHLQNLQLCLRQTVQRWIIEIYYSWRNDKTCMHFQIVRNLSKRFGEPRFTNNISTKTMDALKVHKLSGKNRKNIQRDIRYPCSWSNRRYNNVAFPIHDPFGSWTHTHTHVHNVWLRNLVLISLANKFHNTLTSVLNLKHIRFGIIFPAQPFIAYHKYEFIFSSKKNSLKTANKPSLPSFLR
jgi:hypothetical protein